MKSIAVLLNVSHYFYFMIQCDKMLSMAKHLKYQFQAWSSRHTESITCNLYFKWGYLDNFLGAGEQFEVMKHNQIQEGGMPLLTTCILISSNVMQSGKTSLECIVFVQCISQFHATSIRKPHENWLVSPRDLGN